MFLPLLLFVLTTTAQKNIDFVPIPCPEIKDAKETIEKVYRSQNEKYAPNQIEVTDEYIAWGKQKSKSSFLGYGRSTVMVDNTIYFDMISDFWLIKSQAHFEIIIRSKSSKSNHKIILFDKGLAIEGYSAIQCMIEKSKTNK